MKDDSSSKLPIPLTFRVESKKRYKKSKKMRDFDHQMHTEKLRIRRELKVANEVALFKSKLLKEISRLPTDKKLSLSNEVGSSILDTYYASEFKLPSPMRSQKPTITPSVNTSTAAGNKTMSKPFNISWKPSSLDYARCIIPVHNAGRTLVCSRCFQSSLTWCIDCGNTYMMCIACVKSSEEKRNLRKIEIAKKSLLRNIKDTKTRRKRQRTK